MPLKSWRPSYVEVANRNKRQKSTIDEHDSSTLFDDPEVPDTQDDNDADADAVDFLDPIAFTNHLLESLDSRGSTIQPQSDSHPVVDNVLEAEMLADSVREIERVPEEEFEEEIENEITISEDASPIVAPDNSPSAQASLSDLPPPDVRRPSAPIIDLSEEVFQKRSVSSSYSAFEMALGFFCELERLSRRGYQVLLEILELLTDITEIRSLPRSLDTLKRHIHEMMPLLKLRRKQVDLNPEQLPSLTPREKSLSLPHTSLSTVPQELMYWFDPVDLFRVILSSKELKGRMFFGMGHYVDKPSELWESFAWTSSIRSCSGKFALYPDGRPIFPSDIVELKCANEQCECHSTTRTHTARIDTIGMNYRSGVPDDQTGEISVIARKVVTAIQVGYVIPHFSANANEFFLVEDDYYPVRATNVIRRITNIHVDYKYEQGTSTQPHDTLHISRILNARNKTLRPVQLSDPPRGELELQCYGRPHFEALQNHECLSIPLLTFIDAFGIYRNMYRSLMGIYNTPANLSLYDRTRRNNTFTHTLGPHGSSFEDLINAIGPSMKALDGGIMMDLDGEKHTFVCVYTMAYIGDMPQQNANAGVMSQVANRGCRSCLVPKIKQGDLNFDVVLQRRYHHQIVNQRQKASTITSKGKREQFFNSLSLRETPSPLVRFSPALDIVKSRPADAAHSEYAGIAKQVHGLLFSAILTARGQAEYCAQLRRFPFPPTWARLQSPKRHLKSWQMQECGRASIITPVLLRLWLRPKHINPLYLKAMMQTARLTEIKAVDLLVNRFAHIARSNTIIMARVMSPDDQRNMDSMLRRSRKAFQQLFECAAIASMSAFKHGESPVSSRATTPTAYEEDDFEEFNTEKFATEYEELAETFIVSGKASKKAAEFRKFTSRPNVHLGLHYRLVASEFAVPSNCTTFSGEDKHRQFKKLITTTNATNVVFSLLGMDNIRQSLRFVLDDAYMKNEPEITQKLKSLSVQCPTLFKDVLTTSNDALDTEFQSLELQSDAAHKSPAAVHCIKQSYVQNVLDLPLYPGKLSVIHPFAQGLRHAFEKDYDMTNIFHLSTSRLQYCKKLTFTDPVTNHRISFQVHDFITARGVLGRIDAIFVHEMNRRRRVFTLVQLVEMDEIKEDEVLLGAVLRTFKEERLIVGLPSVAPHKHYILHVEERRFRSGGEETVLRRCDVGSTGSLLLDSKYEIQFM